ncbi:uncharacterized protein ARMOST_11457 [Armillaria ostoyae]|uniref:Heterokaryon incompatibility domain-containing protein n=1 Tax=Armillaria ostoyae TaxID=47428 RepID=A0A284RH72_ARMOS|nr:uncharacterized protein ARMOST_11457 [Armillaria ostoyae]
MDRDEWFRCYYEDVILMNNSDNKRRTQALLKYKKLPEVTVSSFGSRVPKQRSYTGRKPVIPSALADTLCADLSIIQELLEKLNTVLGTSYTLGTAGVRSVLEDCISKKYDFGTAYAHLRPFWYSDLTTTVDDLCEREVQYRRMLEDVLVNDIIIYPRVPPRRVWDLYSNRVVPWYVARQRPWAISHAWMDKCSRQDVLTAINGCEWPVPIPEHTSLDHIRIEMLNLGAEYVWLDVLCLRQQGGLMEGLRMEEWKVDVPTIGSVYAGADKVVCYLSGLGWPLNREAYYSEDDRCWFKRAWTLQEIGEHMIIGGGTGNEVLQVCFEEKLSWLHRKNGQHRVYDVLSQMQERVSTNPVDKVAGMAYLLHSDSIPAYHGEQSEEDAWSLLVDVAAHQCQWDLLFLYPQPGDRTKTWWPSWRQVMTEIPQGQHHSNLQIGCCDQDGKTDANAYYNGYIIEEAFVQGLFGVHDLLEEFAKEFGLLEEFDMKTLAKYIKSAKEFRKQLVESAKEWAKEWVQVSVQMSAQVWVKKLAKKLAWPGKCESIFQRWTAQRITERITERITAEEFAEEFVKYVKELDLGERHYRVGQLVVKDYTRTECSFKITASHQHPIPDGTYTLLGTMAKLSGIHWVIGRRLPDGRLQKVSIAQMNMEVASMDSLVSQSIAKRASTTILA